MICWQRWYIFDNRIFVGHVTCLVVDVAQPFAIFEHFIVSMFTLTRLNVKYILQ